MIYFDNEALEPVKKEVIDVIVEVLTNNYFNPNSIYEQGMESKRLISKSKEIISNEVGCDPDELVFCSSGSEANTMALMGAMKYYNKPHFITSTIGHPSITMNPYAKQIIKVDKFGRFDMEDVENIADEKLVSLAMSDTEIGVTQDIRLMSEIIHDKNGIIHSDLTGSLGKQKINLHSLGVDLAVFSGQKIGSSLGCSCLYIKDGINIEPLIYGHDSLRNGTPNVPSICAMAKAVELIDWNMVNVMKNNRDYFISKLLSNQNIKLNGSLEHRLPNNINITIENTLLNNQQIISLLNLHGFCCSAGSSCNSGSSEPSQTLMGIGLTEEQANKTIRLSLSTDNTIEEIDLFCKTLDGILNRFKCE